MITYEKAVEEDLNIGFGSVSVTNPAGGSMSGNKIGTHTLIQRLFNVMHFGAKGNGITNDYTAIQAALNECNSLGGGIVFFPVPSVEYAIESRLKLYKNTLVMGLDPKFTIIHQHTLYAGGFTFEDGIYGCGCGFKGLTIKGPWNGTYPTGTDGTAWTSLNGNNNEGDAIACGWLGLTTLANRTNADAEWRGNRLTIRDCIVSDWEFCGIAGLGCESRIINTQFLRNSCEHIQGLGDDIHIDSSCYFDTCGSWAIDIGGHRNKVVGCTVFKCGMHPTVTDGGGVALTGYGRKAHGGTVIGVTVDNSSVVTSSFTPETWPSGRWLIYSSEQTAFTIQGNTLIGDHAWDGVNNDQLYKGIVVNESISGIVSGNSAKNLWIGLKMVGTITDVSHFGNDLKTGVQRPLNMDVTNCTFSGGYAGNNTGVAEQTVTDDNCDIAPFVPPCMTTYRRNLVTFPNGGLLFNTTLGVTQIYSGAWLTMMSGTKGTTAAIASGATVTHGLGATPTQVLITATETGLSDVYVSDKGATTFKINYAGGGTHVFDWQALK
jgi:hypothetical protein